MNDNPSTQVDARDFPGMITEQSVQSLPPGASPKQINCTSTDLGKLRSRPGMKLVSFGD